MNIQAVVQRNRSLHPQLNHHQQQDRESVVITSPFDDYIVEDDDCEQGRCRRFGELSDDGNHEAEEQEEDDLDEGQQQEERDDSKELTVVGNIFRSLGIEKDGDDDDTKKKMKSVVMMMPTTKKNQEEDDRPPPFKQVRVVVRKEKTKYHENVNPEEDEDEEGYVDGDDEEIPDDVSSVTLDPCVPNDVDDYSGTIVRNNRSTSFKDECSGNRGRRRRSTSTRDAIAPAAATAAAAEAAVWNHDDSCWFEEAINAQPPNTTSKSLGNHSGGPGLWSVVKLVWKFYSKGTTLGGHHPHPPTHTHHTHTYQGLMMMRSNPNTTTTTTNVKINQDGIKDTSANISNAALDANPAAAGTSTLHDTNDPSHHMNTRDDDRLLVRETRRRTMLDSVLSKHRRKTPDTTSGPLSQPGAIAVQRIRRPTVPRRRGAGGSGVGELAATGAAAVTAASASTPTTSARCDLVPTTTTTTTTTATSFLTQPGAIAVYAMGASPPASPTPSYVFSSSSSTPPAASCDGEDNKNCDGDDVGNDTGMKRRPNMLLKEIDLSNHTHRFWLLLCLLTCLAVVMIPLAVGISVGMTISNNDDNSTGTNGNAINDDGKFPSTQASRMTALLRSKLERHIYSRYSNYYYPSTSKSTGFDVSLFDDPMSSQCKALQWLASHDTITIHQYFDDIVGYGNIDDEKHDDYDTYIERLLARYALAVLYYSGGMSSSTPPANGMAFLDPSLHECVWNTGQRTGSSLDNNASTDAGVVCDSYMRITSLDLAGTSMEGTLPDELFFVLTDLTRLKLSRNSIYGTFPKSLSMLTKLAELDLSENKFTSTIPHELSRLANLQVFNVASNHLTGRLPNTLHFLKNMLHFNVSYNLLSGRALSNELIGTINGNPFAGMGYLESLDLSHCNFGGRIDADSTRNLDSLKELYLDHNFFSGQITSSSLARFTSLEILSASHNQLEYSIPRELGQLASLRILDLSNNLFVGTLPPEISNILSLEELHVNDNMIGGSIPPEFSGLPSLRLLTIQHTRLIGDVDFLCSSLPALTNSSPSELHGGDIVDAIGILADCMGDDDHELYEVYCSTCCTCY